MRIQVCWDVMPFSWVSGFQHVKGTWNLHIRGQVVNRTMLQNVSNLSPIDTALHSRRPEHLSTLMNELEVSPLFNVIHMLM